MNHNDLTWVNEFNYLGYMFDSASKQQDKCEIEIIHRINSASYYFSKARKRKKQEKLNRTQFRIK